MKRIYLILTLIVALGCSKSDSPTTPERNNFLNPPEWLHGSYGYTVTSPETYVFTFDDVFWSIEDTPVLSKSYSDVYSNAEGFTVIEEFNGSSSYKFTMYDSGVPGESLEFVKISNTRIQILYPNDPTLILYADKL